MTSIPDKFCHHCGLKIQVGVNFCPKCGTSQASLNEKPPVAETNIRQPAIKNTRPFVPMVVGADEEADSYIDRVERLSDLNISVSSLEVDFGRTFQPNKETVGGLIAQGAQMPKEAVMAKEPPRPGMGGLSDKQVWESFKNEAGTMKAGSTTEIK